MSADVIHTTINSIGTVVSMLVAVFAIYRSSSKDRIDAAALAKLSADEIIKNINARISQIELCLSGHANKDDLVQEKLSNTANRTLDIINDNRLNYNDKLDDLKSKIDRMENGVLNNPKSSENTQIILEKLENLMKAIKHGGN
jgi:hypothetical protein